MERKRDKRSKVIELDIKCNNTQIIGPTGPPGPEGSPGQSGPSAINWNRTIFVDQKYGTAAGIPEDETKPFSTLLQAQTRAISEGGTWLIFVKPGTYMEGDLGADGVDWYLTDGASVVPTASSKAAFIASTDGYKILGYGVIDATSVPNGTAIDLTPLGTSTQVVDADKIIGGIASMGEGSGSAYFNVRAITSPGTTLNVSNLTVYMEGQSISSNGIVVNSSGGIAYLNYQSITTIGNNVIANSGGTVIVDSDSIQTAGNIAVIQSTGGTTDVYGKQIISMGGQILDNSEGSVFLRFDNAVSTGTQGAISISGGSTNIQGISLTSSGMAINIVNTNPVTLSGRIEYVTTPNTAFNVTGGTSSFMSFEMGEIVSSGSGEGSLSAHSEHPIPEHSTRAVSSVHKEHSIPKYSTCIVHSTPPVPVVNLSGGIVDFRFNTIVANNPGPAIVLGGGGPHTIQGKELVTGTAGVGTEGVLIYGGIEPTINIDTITTDGFALMVSVATSIVFSFQKIVTDTTDEWSIMTLNGTATINGASLTTAVNGIEVIGAGIISGHISDITVAATAITYAASGTSTFSFGTITGVNAVTVPDLLGLLNLFGDVIGTSGDAFDIGNSPFYSKVSRIQAGGSILSTTSGTTVDVYVDKAVSTGTVSAVIINPVNTAGSRVTIGGIYQLTNTTNTSPVVSVAAGVTVRFGRVTLISANLTAFSVTSTGPTVTIVAFGVIFATTSHDTNTTVLPLVFGNNEPFIVNPIIS